MPVLKASREAGPAAKSLGPRPGDRPMEFADGSRIYTARSSDTCRSIAAMFKVDEEEMLELNRKNYPTLGSFSRMVHGSLALTREARMEEGPSIF